MGPQRTFEQATVEIFSPPYERANLIAAFPEELRAGNDGGQSIEGVLFGGLHNFGRQRAFARRTHVSAQFVHDGAAMAGGGRVSDSSRHRLRARILSRRRRRYCNHQPDALQKPASSET